MFAAAGCYQVEQPVNEDGPGTEGWASRQITCESDSECLQSEACLQGVCQMKRCQKGNYSSVPPLGPASFFFHDRDVVVADATMSNGSYRVAGYRADEAEAASSGDSWAMDDRPIADVAGGDVWAGRPEELVVATSGRSDVTILNSSKREALDVGLVPVAVAVADLDADGAGELLSLSANALVNVCELGENQSCKTWDQVREPGLVGVDLGAGDVDGDGRAEAVILGKVDGDSRIIVLNFDAEETNGEFTYGLVQSAYDTVDRLAVGDLNGDRTAEVVATRNGYRTYAYQLASPQGAKPIGDWPTYLSDVRDVAVGDLDMDDNSEVLLLREDRKVLALRARKNGNELDHEQAFESQLTSTASPQRIATTDFDGDSPMATLAEGPILRSGQPTPLFVAYYPPYWAEYSDTPANVYVGESELTTEKFQDTVFMQSAIELGVEADVLGLFKSSLTGRVEKMISEATYETSVSFVGHRVWTQADPELYGPEYAAVLMAANCAHQYIYQIDDPEHRLPDEQGDGSQFTFMVPVDGSTLLMASQRYNALAKALGDLPIIEIPHRIGDPTTYPREMLTVEGFEIPEEDKVVPDPPTYVVSDVGFLGFWLALWDFEGRTSTMQTTLKVKSQFGAPGFKFGAEVGAGWSRSHTLEIGEEAVFGGKLPTLPDDPDTPEDEFAQNAYSFAPVVYRDHYTDAEGNEYSYYVFHYTVGLP